MNHKAHKEHNGFMALCVLRDLGGSENQCCNGFLQPHEVQFDLLVPAIARPEIERRAGHFVDERHGQAKPRQVDALEVMAARVTSIDAQVIEGRAVKVPQLPIVFFPAKGTHDPAEGPPRQTRGAQQQTAAALEIACAMKNRQLRRASAKRTTVGGSRKRAIVRRHAVFGQPLPVRLQDRLREKLMIEGRPPVGEHHAVHRSLAGVQKPPRFVGQRLWSVSGDDGQEHRRMRANQGQILVERRGRSRLRAQRSIDGRLSRQQHGVKRKQTGGRRMLFCELPGTRDESVPAVGQWLISEARHAEDRRHIGQRRDFG